MNSLIDQTTDKPNLLLYGVFIHSDDAYPQLMREGLSQLSFGSPAGHFIHCLVSSVTRQDHHMLLLPVWFHQSNHEQIWCSSK